jgi:acyl-phosphate glycerol 3-phosphate acyltransferase
LALTAESGSLALIVVGAYFIGCFATGYYLVRWRSGDDIRAIGSGGTGARNVGRILARKWAFATVLGDAGKGMLAVFLAGLIEPVPVATMVAMIAATIGHVWPVQLGFRGGKGVATSLGGLLVWSPFLYAVNAVCFGLRRLAECDIGDCHLLHPPADRPHGRRRQHDRGCRPHRNVDAYHLSPSR